MQAAIRDVKRKFSPKMQLAITLYLPGSYQLHMDTRSSLQAATVRWHDNQAQGV
jgi:hypothetical protein